MPFSTFSASPTYTFTPTANFNGAVNLSYDVSDGNGGVLAATQSFSVTAVDDTEFFVTNTNDSGVGSLRQAILDANADAGAETITFVGSVFEDGIPDTITLTSGELLITDAVTINGLGANNLSISGNNSSAVFRIDDSDSNNQIAVAIDGLKITDAYIDFFKISGGYDDSAAITNAENLSINNSTISGNNGSANAGIFNNGGTVAIANSIISDNTGQLNGAAPFAGGITNFLGTVTITNSTISGNNGTIGGITNLFGTVEISNSTISGNSGFVGGVLSGGETTITNSTISGNNGTVLGGIFNAGTATITSSTITNNSGDGVGGLLNDDGAGAITTAQNSIIAGNTGTDASDISGEVIGDGNNLIGSLIGASGTIGTGSDITFESGGITDISQVLAALADNGGATQTHALVSGSAAINAGDNTLIPVDITTDQRGITRTIGDTVDIGAYESDFIPLVNNAPTGSPTATLSDTDEDTEITINAADLLTGFSDVDAGDTLSVANLTADNGVLVDNGDGTYTFTPTADFNGAVNLSYDVTDGTDTLTGQTQTFSVTPVNDAPTGSPTAILSNTAEDTPIIINASDLLAGFSDVDGDTLSVLNNASFRVTATNGTVVNNGNGTYTFTPNLNFNGNVTLRYAVADGQRLVRGTQTFSVTAVNDAPIATPKFITPITNPFGLTNDGAVPVTTFADIDGDGDLDAFVGDGEGNTRFYRNTGTAAAPTFTQEATNPFGLTDVGIAAAPTLADIDGDGDLDAFVGNDAGNTLFFRNTGTAAAPTFTLEATNPFGLRNVGIFAVPTLADIDGDGDLDAFVGNNDGNTVFYRNTGTAAAPTFTLEATNPFGLTSVGPSSAPTFADIDHDGDLDAFVGNQVGSIVFFENIAATTLSNTTEDTAIIINAADLLTRFSDVEGDTISVVNLTADNGVLVDNNNGTYTFTPTANFNGTVTLSYGVSDGTDTLNGQTQTFSVTPVNDALTGSPTATLSNTAEDTAITINAADLLAGFSDVDAGDTLSVVNLTADNGVLVDNGDGTYTFTPTADFNGAVN
ncbi:S-layer family protein, partial [Anabaena sp. UHCC 0253]|uniref:beta strand repeat-containing protein n=1 Tax=Anabaena sp. UHCC 0253 TaxID=2590019 RepID=UPI001447422B